jgi:CRISPR-associated endonuclease/helicase Cas3
MRDFSQFVWRLMNFTDFFQTATGNTPYDYQRRLAGGDQGADCNSQLINIPTGLGKTAAVVLAWLWNRVGVPREAPNSSAIGHLPSAIHQTPWPRRLVYCLPMRTLVEQTEREVRCWILRLARRHTKPRDGSELRWLALHSPIILMGGQDADKDWDIHPERPAILIGTQDMLLSRALNRGYGMSRYRWPMHFGLLNNDCLWIMDETQLMGVGVETSAQLDGFRQLAQWANAGKCPTWWMSATLEETRLVTVDHPQPTGGWDKITLSVTERGAKGVRERFEARKPVVKESLALNADTKKSYAAQLAALIAKKHQPGSLTLAVLNRVPRAREVYAALKKLKVDSVNPSRIALIHSRFRPVDRERHTKLLFGEGDRIVIATQAVEAGVDVSARLLITELAPWSSLVQRIGRCNREGKMNDKAEVVWIDIQPKDDKNDLLLPYTADDLKKAHDVISELKDVGPQSLDGVRVPETPIIRPVVRRRDLIDLFDTTPDLCGQDLDISRYVRDGEDSDVQFFWRAVPEDSKPDSDEKAPQREELCRVSIGEADKFLKKNRDRTWQWNSLDEVWDKAERARPGGVYLIDAACGGYDDDLGWTGDAKSTVTPLPPADDEADAQGKDLQTFDRDWILLSKHTEDVVATTMDIVGAMSFDSTMTDVFHSAAHWHDIGKAHEDFQNALRFGPCQPNDASAFYAKSKNPYNPAAMTKERRGFRHELASALAWLSASPLDVPERDLVAYLIAAHHGKVRLSIRALPDEKGDTDKPDRLFARGIWDQDELPAVPGVTDKPVALDLSLMHMGEGESGPSWLCRMIALRDRFGPFYLAYLETLLRAADMRASAEEAKASRPVSETGVSSGMNLQEQSTEYAPPKLSEAEQSLVADLVSDGLSIQEKFRPEPVYKQTGKGHYQSDTVEEIRQAKKKGKPGKQ